MCLDGDRLCMMTAEADVEEEISVRNKILRLHPRMTVRSNLQVRTFLILKDFKRLVFGNQNLSLHRTRISISSKSGSVTTFSVISKLRTKKKK